MSADDKDRNGDEKARVAPPLVRLTSQGVRDLNNHGPRKKPAEAAEAAEPAETKSAETPKPSSP